MYNILINL